MFSADGYITTAIGFNRIYIKIFLEKIFFIE